MDDFLGGLRVEVSPKVPYRVIQDPAKRTYLENFTTWVLLKRGYNHFTPAQVSLARAVLKGESNPLTIWKAELKNLMAKLTKPTFPSPARYIIAAIVADLGIFETDHVDREVVESSSYKEMPVVLPAALGTEEALEERRIRRAEENSDDKGSKEAWMLSMFKTNKEACRAAMKRK